MVGAYDLNQRNGNEHREANTINTYSLILVYNRKYLH